VAKRIAAKSGRPVLGVFKHLLLHGTSIEGPRQSRFKIVDMDVEMHGRPVALVVARLLRVNRGSGAPPFLQQADIYVAGAEYGHARHGRRGLCEAKGTCIETNGIDKVWYINANRHGVLFDVSHPVLPEDIRLLKERFWPSLADIHLAASATSGCAALSAWLQADG